MAKYRIISSDDHVFEPPDLWTSRVEPKFRDRAPYLERMEDGGDWWFCEGERFSHTGGGTQPGRRFEEPEKLTIKDTYENVLPGGYIPEDHVKDMDADGVGREYTLSHHCHKHVQDIRHPASDGYVQDVQRLDR